MIVGRQACDAAITPPSTARPTVPAVWCRRDAACTERQGQRLQVSPLSLPAGVDGRPPPQTLGGRRSDDPRQPDPALSPAPPAGTEEGWTLELAHDRDLVAIPP